MRADSRPQIEQCIKIFCADHKHQILHDEHSLALEILNNSVTTILMDYLHRHGSKQACGAWFTYDYDDNRNFELHMRTDLSVYTYKWTVHFVDTSKITLDDVSW